MKGCSFNKLVQLLDKELDLDAQLDVYDHLDQCTICREAIYLISRDRDEGLLIFRPFNLQKQAVA